MAEGVATGAYKGRRPNLYAPGSNHHRKMASIEDSIDVYEFSKESTF